MSQEQAKKQDTSETRKKILLGVLLAVMVGVFYFQFFTGDDPVPAASNVATTAQRQPSPTPTPRPLRPGEKAVPIITQPLQFAWFDKRIAGDGTGRNIFVYPPPPTPTPMKPVPPPPPTPPPPIQLISLNPGGVIGRTGGFTMNIFGDKIPEDAQAFFDGRPYPTKFLNATKVEVQIPPEAIRNGGNPGVQVRSKSDAAMYSNQLSFNISEPPLPPYKYVGFISNKRGVTAVLKSQADEAEVHSVTKGGKVGTHWRIVNITPKLIEIEDLNIKIVHTINFTVEPN